MPPTPQSNPLTRILSTLFLPYLGLITTIQFYPTTLQAPAAAIAGTLFTALFAVSLLRTSHRRNADPLTNSLVCATLLTAGIAAIWGHVEILSSVRLPHIPVLVFPVALLLLIAPVNFLLAPTPRTAR